jgi:hypothetical protein
MLGQDLPPHKPPKDWKDWSDRDSNSGPRIISNGQAEPVSSLVSESQEQLTLAQQVAKNMATYFYNPWAMVEDQIIYTLDSTDLLNPVKAFPNHPWLQRMSEDWMREPLYSCFKSRRMTITWLFVFLHLWLAMFREGASVFFVSDKEEKSDELVKRAEFIYNNIPPDKMLKPACKSSYCYLEFPGLNSYIQGVPQGADQLRQYTATAILNDEFAFWSKARETFMASKPTIDGGGKVTLISSPQEGFFKELCFDLIR